MHQALRDPDQEQQGRLLVVVPAQPPEQPCQPGIVGASAYQPCKALSLSHFRFLDGSMITML